MSDEDPVREMTQDECWEMLRRTEFGRLAFHLGPEVHLVPINYAVYGRTLLFRTAPGSKLVGVAMNADVVFEIDEYDEHSARSVIMRGVARRAFRRASRRRGRRRPRGRRAVRRRARGRSARAAR